jgi:hypothetical protein
MPRKLGGVLEIVSMGRESRKGNRPALFPVLEGG